MQVQFDLPLGQADVMAVVLGDFTQRMLAQRYSLASHSEGAAVFARRRASRLGAVGGLIGGGAVAAVLGGGMGGVVLTGAAESAFSHHKDAVAITALGKSGDVTKVSIVGRGPAGTHETISELRKQLVLASLKGAPAACPRCGTPQKLLTFCTTCSAALMASASSPEPQTQRFAARFEHVLSEVYAGHTPPAALFDFGPSDCPVQQVLHGVTGTLGEAVVALEKLQGTVDATVDAVQCDGERFWVTTTLRRPLPGRAIESIKPDGERIGNWLVWSEFGEH